MSYCYLHPPRKTMLIFTQWAQLVGNKSGLHHKHKMENNFRLSTFDSLSLSLSQKVMLQILFVYILTDVACQKVYLFWGYTSFIHSLRVFIPQFHHMVGNSLCFFVGLTVLQAEGVFKLNVKVWFGFVQWCYGDLFEYYKQILTLRPQALLLCCFLFERQFQARNASSMLKTEYGYTENYADYFQTLIICWYAMDELLYS